MSATLPHLVTSFFRSYLADTSDRSPNTIASYSDCIRLLLNFACTRLAVSIDQLSMDAISDELILEFLDNLATERGNSASTRHQRLAAIRTFYKFLALHEPSLLATCERIHAIRITVPQRQPVTVLEPRQVQAILQAPDPHTVAGVRDRAILLLLYNTGMRVQELCDLRLGHIRCRQPAQIDITGKGRKQRQLPLWPETVQAIAAYLRSRPPDQPPQTPLFVGRTERALSRFAIRKLVRRHTIAAASQLPDLDHRRVSPHTFRHTTATQLIKSNANIAEVRDWLGHSDVRTTMVYTHIDQEAKRRALERCPAPSIADPTQTPQWAQPNVIDFLARLSRSAGIMLPAADQPVPAAPVRHQSGHIRPQGT